MESTSSGVIATARDIFIFLLSWLVLTAIAIIISGKLMARRIPLGFVDDDIFDINLVFFRLRAKGDEVSLGFIVFILNLTGWVIFGGAAVYRFIKANAGIDIGQWNSLCATSSFASILLAFIFFLLSGWATGVPVLASDRRSTMLNRVAEIKEINDGN